MSWFKQISLMVMLFLLTLTHSAWAESTKTNTYHLKNGLKIIVRPVHKAPVVVTMVWYKVGSADEPPGLSGISHVLEHMMFKGTKNLAVGEYSKIIASNGGQENAFTNRDYTAYFQTLGAKKLPISLKLEADRMQNLQLEANEFAKEIKVVREERRMRTDDNPQSLTYERFMASLHLASPYHHPVIGWKNDLLNMQITDLKKWYARWYAPNNATLVVVGDVEPKDVFNLAKKYFGPIKSEAMPSRKPQRMPEPLGTKQIEISMPAKLPMVFLGFNVPSLLTSEDKMAPYALEVLAGILGANDSSRLNKMLVRTQHVASSINADYDLFARFDSEFVIYAIPATEVPPEKLVKAIQGQINDLKQQPVTQAELSRIKNQVIAHHTYQKDSLFGQAMAIGLTETAGLNWQESEEYPKKIQQVTLADIQKAANTYLTAKRLTIAILKPSQTRN